jgi:hypothetical protein
MDTMTKLRKCKEMMDILYEFIRNDGKIYKESEPLRKRMEDALYAKYLRGRPYNVIGFAIEFGLIAGSKNTVERLAREMDEMNDGDKKEGNFLRQHRTWIGDDAGKYLEEYYRTELCLHLNMPMVHSSHCAACQKPMTLAQCEKAISGKYCSDACYDTLFADCVICGQKNMTCLTNQKTPYIPSAKLECACDQCLQKKYNISIVTIGCDSHIRN